MNPEFFQQVETSLAAERLDAYRQDGAAPATALARYLCNIAISESLYAPLQMAEIALRNSVHRCLIARFGTAQWFDTIPSLTPWQKQRVEESRQKLQTTGKAVTPGSMVAELNFGFWTGFFNKAHGGTGLGHTVASRAFAHAPREERDMKKLDARWKQIRDLRNRVFHHERIIHWGDLDTQHAAILEVIGWLSPELRDLTLALDRFTALRRDGLHPWLARIRHHWPEQAATPSIAPSAPVVAIVPEAFDATSGAETPFGHRWGGDVFRLSTEHLAALQAGQTLALDVQNEYIAFLKAAESAKLEQAIKANLRRLGYGG